MSTHVGWMVCYSVNAKNAYGGYVGAREHVVVITDGEVAAEYWSKYAKETVEEECSLPSSAVADEPAAGAADRNPKVGI